MITYMYVMIMIISYVHIIYQVFMWGLHENAYFISGTPVIITYVRILLCLFRRLILFLQRVYYHVTVTLSRTYYLSGAYVNITYVRNANTI